MESKKCLSCQLVKPTADFYIAKPPNFQARCKSCYNADYKEKYIRHPREPKIEIEALVFIVMDKMGGMTYKQLSEKYHYPEMTICKAIKRHVNIPCRLTKKNMQDAEIKEKVRIFCMAIRDD